MTAPLAAAIAFFVFIGLLGYFGAHRKLLELLDTRSQTVKTELDEAQRRLNEAQALLDDLEKQRAQAALEAESIIRAGRKRAEEMTRDAATQMAEFVKRRTEQAERRIALARAEVRKEVQMSVLDVAARAVEQMLLGDIGQAKAADLISDGIREVGAGLRRVKAEPASTR